MVRDGTVTAMKGGIEAGNLKQLRTTLQQRADRRAKAAIESRSPRAARRGPLRLPCWSQCRLAAALGGLDAFVFTAGIGENSPIIRARIAEKLAWLGAVFDPAANADGKSLISWPDSRVVLLVVPTDEELMIAQHTLALLPRREQATFYFSKGMLYFSRKQTR
jgi:acetate kinase